MKSQQRSRARNITFLVEEIIVTFVIHHLLHTLELVRILIVLTKLFEDFNLGLHIGADKAKYRSHETEESEVCNILINKQITT